MTMTTNGNKECFCGRTHRVAAVTDACARGNILLRNVEKFGFTRISEEQFIAQRDALYAKIDAAR